MPTQKSTTILIVDDHPLVRAGLRQLIADEADLRVCGEADGMSEAMRILKKLTPDVAIVDLSLANGSGLDLIKRIYAVAPSVRILVSSMYDESIFAERALRAGAMGYVNKQQASENVIKAIRQLLSGKLYLSARMTDRLIHQGITGVKRKSGDLNLAKLSDREVEVFDLIGRGFSTNQIAAKLSLSIKTIETHRAHIKKKLNLRSPNELTVRAVQWSLER